MFGWAAAGSGATPAISITASTQASANVLRMVSTLVHVPCQTPFPSKGPLGGGFLQEIAECERPSFAV